MNEWSAIDEQIKNWLLEAADLIREALNGRLEIDTKTSEKDLVTNVDCMIEKFIVEKIRQHHPTDRILGEEGFGDKIEDLDGRIWIIDPIDGTMNFVKQKDYFAIMVAIYENGTGKIGYIYDVIADKLYWGGPVVEGVFEQNKMLQQPENIDLSEGLIGINSGMFAKNSSNAQKIGQTAAGIRMLGCAGLEFVQILLGKQIAYISNISPWDYAAGKILAEQLGLKVSNIDGSEVSLLKKEQIVVATSKAHKTIIEMVKKK